MDLQSKLLTAGAMIALMIGAYFYVDNRGYERARAECEQQRVVQELANREAADLAAERLMREASELSLKNMELEDALAAIDQAAEANPDGDRICLAADSVGRLQSIR